MQVTVRLTDEEAKTLALLGHGLHLLRSAEPGALVLTYSKAFKRKRTICLTERDAEILNDMMELTELPRSAIIRAALKIAETSSLLPAAPLLARDEAMRALRAGATVQRTESARTYGQAAEIIGSDGSRIGFVAQNVLASIPASMKAGGGAIQPRTDKQWPSLAVRTA